MKHIVVILLLSIWLFAEQDSFPKKEYFSEQDLIEAESIDKPLANLVLAQAYEVGMPEKGIEQNIEKALELYKKVYDVNKDPIAASKLGLYYFTKEVKENKDYGSEKYFINGINNNDYSMTEYNTVMAGVVFFKKKRYKDAIKYLGKYANNGNKVGNPTSEIYLAFTYNEINKDNLATKYLTRACTNPKATKDIKSYCSNTQIKKEDLNSLLNDLE